MLALIRLHALHQDVVSSFLVQLIANYDIAPTPTLNALGFCSVFRELVVP